MRQPHLRDAPAGFGFERLATAFMNNPSYLFSGTHLLNRCAREQAGHNYFNTLARSLRLWLNLLSRGPDQEIIRRIVVG